MATKKTTGPSAATIRGVMAAQSSVLGGSDDGVTVEDRGGVLRFTFRGVAYATLRIEGDRSIATIRRPAEVPAEVDLARFYTPGPIPGWVTFRTEASRSPQRWIQANVGSLVGQVMFEREKHPERVYPDADLTIAASHAPGAVVTTALLGPADSEGGPYLLAPAKAAERWKGSADETAYFAMARAADPATRNTQAPPAVAGKCSARGPQPRASSRATA